MKMAQKSTKTKTKGKFRTNVIATFLVISFVSLAATGFISLTFVDLIGNSTRDQSSAALETQIQTNMDETAQKTALVINQKLSSAEGMIAAAAVELEALFETGSTYEYRDVYYDLLFEDDSVSPAPADNHYDANYGLNVSWDFSSWYVANTDSTNYNSTYADIPANADKLGRVSNIDYIFKAIRNQVEFRWLYIAFADDGLFINYPGSILGPESDLERLADPYNPRGEYWYQTIWDGNGDMVFVEPYYDEFDEVLLISIGKVVYRDSIPFAVISGDITIEDINDKIINVEILDSGYAFLLASDGGVVAHPEVGTEDYLLGLPPLLEVEINPDFSAALTQANVDQITSVAAGTSGTLRYTRAGTEHILVFTQVGKGDYICVISVPLDEVLESIPLLEARIATQNAAAASYIILVTAAGILIAGIVAVAISNTVTRPLQYLMDLAERNVAARIRDQPLDTTDLQVDQTYIAQDDEIGELARAFQGMLDSIREDEN
ncbi:MAG: HAMP domain-containing protein [Candidatus Thorarchaeota archaeon]|nr:MAG: HAMP domain-containing protein [Candidatus Thorarchaeota archaeon]